MQAAGQPAKDARVETAIHHWAPRFVSSGVPLTDFEEVTAGISRWDEWCAAWGARAAVHEELGRKALAEGYKLSAGEHLNRAAICYHFGKFMFVHDIPQMKAANGAARSTQLRLRIFSIGWGKYDGGAIEALFESRGDDTDYALMPVCIPQTEGGAGCCKAIQLLFC